MAVIIGIKVHKYKAELTSLENQHLPIIILLLFFTENAAILFHLTDVFDPPWCPKLFHVVWKMGYGKWEKLLIIILLGIDFNCCKYFFEFNGFFNQLF